MEAKINPNIFLDWFYACARNTSVVTIMGCICTNYVGFENKRFIFCHCKFQNDHYSAKPFAKIVFDGSARFLSKIVKDNFLIWSRMIGYENLGYLS